VTLHVKEDVLILDNNLK